VREGAATLAAKGATRMGNPLDGRGVRRLCFAGRDIGVVAFFSWLDAGGGVRAT
jgi:hypothetical protein